ncbi:hypothetical protein T492DRAFT_934726 [Pavlovales sp. CCMP2436]|nr:hypothetical protein T492DRAFT_934726 [Pavlovales sp. CCMP2436]
METETYFWTWLLNSSTNATLLLIFHGYASALLTVSKVSFFFFSSFLLCFAFILERASKRS